MHHLVVERAKVAGRRFPVYDRDDGYRSSIAALVQCYLLFVREPRRPGLMKMSLQRSDVPANSLMAGAAGAEVAAAVAGAA